MVELARSGGTEELVAHLDRRAPVKLTNENADTLLLLAAYHGHAETVAALLARRAHHARVQSTAGLLEAPR
jgi:ankyrin repeat protein